MVTFLLGLVIGLFIGSGLGVFFMCLFMSRPKGMTYDEWEACGDDHE
jgi:Na+/H+ antiporter NhaA